LKLFAAAEVRYLIVGGYAVMKYTEPRFTKDLDLLISTEPKNAAAVYRSLKAFGAPLTGLTEADFTAAGFFYQMGRPPLRIDVLMDVPGVDFEQAWTRRETVALGGVPMHFISKDDLICAKEAAGRPQDLLDLANLRA
jgi:hypothetical protein